MLEGEGVWQWLWLVVPGSGRFFPWQRGTLDAGVVDDGVVAVAAVVVGLRGKGARKDRGVVHRLAAGSVGGVAVLDWRP